MSSDPLTHDNSPLSSPSLPVGDHAFAIDCTDLSPTVVRFVRASLSENTQRAYKSDLEHFFSWGGRIPSTAGEVATYIAELGGTFSLATLARRLASISVAHQSRDLPNPVRSALVRATMRGMRRTFGSAQTAVTPLVLESLLSVISAMGLSIKDARDRALLLIGFAGAFRRSELVSLDRNDVRVTDQELILRLRRSKTDQIGSGRMISISPGQPPGCPVSALEFWLSRSGINSGPLFRSVDRHSHVLDRRLSPSVVSLIIKTRVAAAGFDPARFSGHSLRAGHVTSAAHAGIPIWRIRQQTGHASDAMVARYIRSANASQEVDKKRSEP